MNLYAFDCDGTLDSSSGPIPSAFLQQLKAKGHVVCIVSPSGACSGLPFEHFTGGADRLQNLLAAKAAHPDCQFYYYFSDNGGDEALAGPSGFTVVKLV